jgi:hypothetical protein
MQIPYQQIIFDGLYFRIRPAMYFHSIAHYDMVVCVFQILYAL